MDSFAAHIGKVLKTLSKHRKFSLHISRFRLKAVGISQNPSFVCNVAAIITGPKERQKNPSVGFSAWQFVLQLLSSTHTVTNNIWQEGRGVGWTASPSSLPA
uniref:Uncharacterized protein n=1 Tax=Anas platyrhynchos platyrhynchos TaxID=8840 RepID=A0A493TJD4_ANAPP